MWINIREDDLCGPEIADLLQVHLASMVAHSPPESRHALDLEALRAPDITFWTAWREQDLLGTGALKELNRSHGEIKSMHTRVAVRGQGVAKRILDHIMAEANRRGYRQLSLETGSMEAFAPARALYRQYGFAPCSPFADYCEDPNSTFMTATLPPER